MINDIYQNTSNNLSNTYLSLDEIKKLENFTVAYSDQMNNNCNLVKDFLSNNVYNHKKLLDKREYSKKIINKLFIYFKNNNNKLPSDWITQDIEIERLICDYISGMTDRFAINLYKEIYE